MAQVVECKALSSNPSTKKKEKNVKIPGSEATAVFLGKC
jgi:hypothetical protein